MDVLRASKPMRVFYRIQCTLKNWQLHREGLMCRRKHRRNVATSVGQPEIWSIHRHSALHGTISIVQRAPVTVQTILMIVLHCHVYPQIQVPKFRANLNRKKNNLIRLAIHIKNTKIPLPSVRAILCIYIGYNVRPMPI